MTEDRKRQLRKLQEQAEVLTRDLISDVAYYNALPSITAEQVVEQNKLRTEIGALSAAHAALKTV